ncbi:MAG TPA: hypothetical protein VN192_00065 [Flavobacterium sp.]|jgi:hypothetical protein|nr:hypothetical protein [Flavobacterium sp.]
MKCLFQFLFIIFISNTIFAQGDFINNSTAIAPMAPKMNTPNTITPSVFNLNTKPTTKSTTSILEENKIEFLNSNQFQKPGDLVKDKLNQGDGVDNSKIFRKNQFLGDFKSNSAYVKISYRDFGAIDGDLISILVNDKVVISKIYLDGSFQGIDLPLEKGFNKIEFMALNEGYSAPNTAEFRIFDDQGFLVSSNQWNLATGFKASIILVKE